MAQDIAEQERRLHEQLRKLKWPQPYMFKFIMPSDRNTMDAVLEVLPSSAEPRFSESKNGRYTCITCVAVMNSADALMAVTKAACAVKGVISL